MDQTPFFFEARNGKTIAKKGSRTVSVKSQSNYADYRVTAALTVSAAGEKVIPYVIFKGKSNAVVDKEVSKFNGSIARAQDKAWMDQPMMLDWIERVWKPITQKLDGPTLLLLDCFKVHMTSATREAIEACGTEIEMVPPGCTCVVQPLDVGINKPMKDYAINEYQDWCFKRDQTKKVNMVECRKLLNEWIVTAWDNLSHQIVKNSWRSMSKGVPLLRES